MKKLRSIILVLFLLFSSLFMMNEKVDATQGVLDKGSIEKCSDVLWGSHNKKRRHWHEAIKHPKNYYALDWSHEYKRVGKCNYKLATAKKKKIQLSLTRILLKKQVIMVMEIIVRI